MEENPYVCKTRQQFEEQCSKYPEFAQVLRHYGYDPLVYGMLNSTATWDRERMDKEFPFIKAISDMFKGRKLRIVIDYDPEYPKTMHRVEQIPTVEVLLQ